jgi:hypothetical protein
MHTTLRSPRLAAWIVAAGLRGACSPGAQMQTVGGVSVEVPGGWETTTGDLPDGVVANGAWRSDADASRNLQVLVACGGESADELTIAAASRARPPLTLVDLEEAVAVDLDGMDGARRTELTFAAEGSDAPVARLAGLYASGNGALVLVELAAPVRSYDAALADAVLGSVRVDADELAAGCA